MEHKQTRKKLRVTVVNFQGGAKKVVVVDTGDWDSLIRQVSDKFRIRRDQIRLIDDWAREEIQRKDFTENMRIDADGGLKLILMEDSVMQKENLKGPLTRETKVSRSVPNANRPVNYTKIMNNVKKGKKKNVTEVLDRTFVLDETLPPLELDENILGERSKPHGLFEILPFLYLGEEKTSRKREMLGSFGITHILNVAAHCTNHYPDHFTYLKISLYDDMRQDLLEHFHNGIIFIGKHKIELRTGIPFIEKYTCGSRRTIILERQVLLLISNHLLIINIEEVRKSGGKVLVHCQGGISRSTSFIIAYLMKVYDKPFIYCHKFLRSKKSSIKPNDNFLQQLRQWEDDRYRYSLIKQALEEEFEAEEKSQEETLEKDNSNNDE